MHTLEAAVKRIAEMELIFDSLLAAVDAPESLADGRIQRQMQKLTAYYEGGQWLADFQLDEQGLLPGDLKRGVLSEDGVYDLLSELDMWLQEEQEAAYL